MSEESGKLDQVRFIFEKARHHRTLHADGAWAGVTPQLEVQVVFFNDLKLMPESVTHLVTPEGLLGKEISREYDRDSVMREANITVVMNKEAIKRVVDLLNLMVKQIENAEPQASPQPNGEPTSKAT